MADFDIRVKCNDVSKDVAMTQGPSTRPDALARYAYLWDTFFCLKVVNDMGSFPICQDFRSMHLLAIPTTEDCIEEPQIFRQCQHSRYMTTFLKRCFSNMNSENTLLMPKKTTSKVTVTMEVQK